MRREDALAVGIVLTVIFGLASLIWAPFLLIAWLGVLLVVFNV